MAEKEFQQTMSAASMAISEPVPRAIPISAALSDGASLTPLPSCPRFVSGLELRGRYEASARGLYERTQFHDNRKSAPLIVVNAISSAR